MNSKTAAVLFSGLLFACAQTQPPQAAAPPASSPTVASAPAPATAPASAGAPTPAATPAPAPTQAAAPARVDHVVTIQRATCQGLMKLAPDDRAAAAMFYIGYQASRSRATTINVAIIPSIEAQAFVYCQENPDEPLVRAFAEAYSRAR
jgi:pyruvate/2-oxoglutarate dehydrogenase complex dihydrolipoamide acyltransferase (E2) component